MREHLLLLDLVDEPAAIAAYDAHHAAGQVWPEVTAAIRASGIHAMRIYRLGTRLAMVMETDDRFDPAAKAAADAADPVVQRWETLMAGFQRAVPGGGPEEKWRVADRIFDLASQR